MPQDDLSFGDRKRAFVSALKNSPDFDDGWRLTENFGQSNKSRIIDGGIVLCNSNLEDLHTDNYQGHIFASVVGLPPEDEFWYAVYIQSDLNTLHNRLQFMQKEGRQDNPRFSDRNNNAKLYLYSDHGIYLENKQFFKGLSDSDDFSPQQSGPSVAVDRIVYSVYSRSALGQRTNVAAGSMVDRLSRFVGPESITRIDPWPEDAQTNTTLQRSPGELDLSEISSGIKKLGGYYSTNIVERYHVGLNHIPHKHFVILSGLSGTGKTGLATRYARTVHGIENTDQEDPFLFMCPVRPEWTDPTGLIGHYDPIGDRYVVPPFLEAMLVARDNPDSPVFVCLDEMNLARVEYYLADVLSAIESQERINLHSDATPIQGNHGGEVPPSMHVPSNLYITGTINIDETTRPLSDKVLDRAVVVNLTASDPGGYLDDLASRDEDLQSAVGECKELLVQTHSILAKEDLAFGYRTAKEFVQYVKYADEHGNQGITDVLDSQMLQKVLPKLQGGHRQREMLDSLESHFSSQGLSRSVEMIQDLKTELDRLGSFQASR